MSEMVERVRQAIEARASKLKEIGGCGNHYCLVWDPPGQHTNGPCTCSRDHMKMQRFGLVERQFIRDLDAALKS